MTPRNAMTANTPVLHRSAEEQAHLEAILRDMFEHRICFNEVLGFRVASFEPCGPSLCFDMRPDLIGHYLHGRLHGGVISSALDTAGGFAAMVAVCEKFGGEPAIQAAHRFGRVGTIDLRVDYLQQGIGRQFTATGRVTRLGGRIASTQMTLENEAGLLIATGCGSYVIS
jgi:uncharacterized protein (TIGR00369 family)